MADADTEARLARLEAAMALSVPICRAGLPHTAAGWEGRRFVSPVVQGCGCRPEGRCVRATCPYAPGRQGAMAPQRDGAAAPGIIQQGGK